MTPFIDTNIIIRYLTGDDPKKQEQCARLFERIETGKTRIFTPDIVIAECTYVLSSPRLYDLTHEKIRALLVPILRLPNFEVQNKRILLNTLDIYAASDIDFEDAYILATMQHMEAKRLISYDTEFDKFPYIKREEP